MTSYKGPPLFATVKTWMMLGYIGLVACGVPESANNANASTIAKMNGATNKARGDASLSGEDHRPMQLIPLTAPEIKTRLIDSRITPDPSIKQAHIGFSEEFFPDGTWKSNRSERTVMTIMGFWRIKEDQICISVAGHEEVCRDVWLDKQTGKIALIDAGSGLGNILIMLSSSLR